MTFEGFVGVTTGGAITFFVQWFAYRRQRRDAQKIAAMAIATQLRRWMGCCVDVVEKYKLHDSSGGHAGEETVSIPEMPFENALDRIALLPSRDSQSILELIHAKDNLEGWVQFQLDVASDDDAKELFRRELAEMFFSALEIYKRLAKRVRWKNNPFSDRQLKKMRSECADESAS